MAAIAFGADNTLGTWKRDAAKSKSTSGASPLTNLTVMREAADGGVKVSVKGERADGSKMDYGYTAKYDGKEVAVTGTGTGNAWRTIAIKQVNANTLTEEPWKKGTKYHSTGRTVVSADGKRRSVDNREGERLLNKKGPTPMARHSRQ